MPIALMIAAWALLSAAGASQPLDELPNTGFEEVAEATGLPLGWNAYSRPNGAAYSLADARTGVACAAIVDDSPQAAQGLRSDRVRIKPGVTYRASVWTKILSGEAPGAALYLEFWVGNQRIENYSKGVSEAPDWTQISVEHIAPDGAETATVLIYAASTTVVHSLFDDAALQRVD